jgi:uncharacterized membrane protein
LRLLYTLIPPWICHAIHAILAILAILACSPTAAKKGAGDSQVDTFRLELEEQRELATNRLSELEVLQVMMTIIMMTIIMMTIIMMTIMIMMIMMMIMMTTMLTMLILVLFNLSLITRKDCEKWRGYVWTFQHYLNT